MYYAPAEPPSHQGRNSEFVGECIDRIIDQRTVMTELAKRPKFPSQHPGSSCGVTLMSPQSLKSSTAQRALAKTESGNFSLPPHVRVSRRAASGIQTPGSNTADRWKQSSGTAHGLHAGGSLRSGKFDTNLRSYDRRDPFNAINTLIELLASLPSRVIGGGGGGRQFRLLSADEHKLCMHLCNVVEPFILSSLTHDDIGSGNSTNPHALLKPRVLLMRQPTEILDRIVSFIEAREDLMNFGLTCKRLSEVVFPRHWEYRLIRAKVSMVGVWKHLHERTDLAANVRIVEVVDERSDRRVLVPRVCRKTVGSSGLATKSRNNFEAGVKPEAVVSATSTEEDTSSSSADETGDEKGGAVAKKVSIHERQEKYFVAALAKLTGLVKIKWDSNHSPMSVVDNSTVWRTLVESCGGSLRAMEVSDNMVFSPLWNGDTGDVEEHAEGDGDDKLVKSALTNLRSISLRATQSSYGTPKTPSFARIASILHQCPNIHNLEIAFKNPPASKPVANEFLLYGRWSQLTSITLTNLTCFTTTTVTITPSLPAAYLSSDSSVPAPTTTTVYQNPLQTFLLAHSNLETLKVLDVGPTPQFRRLREPPRNMLPKLRELHANRDVINMILRAECDEPRPLQVIKGFKLMGAALGSNPSSSSGTEKYISDGTPNASNVNEEFYRNLRKAGATVKRVEVEGWGDLDDIRVLARCVPGLTWLDVGRRLRSAGPNNNNPLSGYGSNTSGGRGQAQGPVTNMVEWAEALSGFEELTTFHGVKFFYEISPNALPNNGTLPNDTSTGSAGATYIPPPNHNANILMTDRSRIRKNDEIASVLAWKCGKLRRVDHWDGAPGATGGKVIVLFRDSDYGPGVEGNAKVRWDVRKVRV